MIEELIGLARELREASARGERLRLSGRRTGLLRRARRQTTAPASARRRDAAWHRSPTCRDRTEQRDHRLDTARERPRQTPRSREAHPAEARLPAEQAGVADADGTGTSRGPVCRLGDLIRENASQESGRRPICAVGKNGSPIQTSYLSSRPSTSLCSFRRVEANCTIFPVAMCISKRMLSFLVAAAPSPTPPIGPRLLALHNGRQFPSRIQTLALRSASFGPASAGFASTTARYEPYRRHENVIDLVPVGTMLEPDTQRILDVPPQRGQHSVDD